MNAERLDSNTPPLKAADYLIASKKCELQNLEYFLQMGRLVLCISNLVHALQRERGASNVFLGSGGHRFRAQREGILATTDEHQQAFQCALQDVHAEMTRHPVSSRLLNQIALALHGLSDLALLRERVGDLAIPAADAIDAYSERIRNLIAVVFEAADTAADPAVAGILVAMVHLMNGKELAGQERAVGSAGFSRGRFDTALSQRMTHLIEAQQRCFEVFAGFADPDSLAIWQTFNSRGREQELERLRHLGCSIGRYKDLDPALADEWFALMSERIDELKTVEDALEACFHARCTEKYTHARHSLAHQETLVASLDRHDQAPQPVLVLCDATEARESFDSDGVGQRFGRSIFDLVQQQSERLQGMSDELQAAKEALEDRKTQEKAVLLLMRHRQVSNDEAHRLLRKLAMNQGKKLPDVARSILAMADVLE